MKKTILLGVTSGIAAYKTLELISILQKQGHEVKVIMTASAASMVPVSDFEKASGFPVATTLFEKGFDYKTVLQTRKVDHITLADSADCMVIVPATANTVAKLAQGIADDYLTTTVLAVTAPVIVCPSMNVHMWEHPATQKNLAILKSYGYTIIEPTEGMLACGYEGKGRLADMDAIHTIIGETLEKSESLKGKKIIVTAGGTVEAIDDVRAIANKSSGKMGVAIAFACQKRGADVLLLKSTTATATAFGIPQKSFTTADELERLLMQEAGNADILFHAAAVSDFSVDQKTVGKLASDTKIGITLTPRKKIVDTVAKAFPKLTLIAFKAESDLSEERLIQATKKRLVQTGIAAMVANDVGKQDRGFGVDTNEVVIVLADGRVKKLPLATKTDIAQGMIDYLLSSGVFSTS